MIVRSDSFTIDFSERDPQFPDGNDILKSPYFKYLKRFLYHDLIDLHPELEDEYVSRIKELELGDPLLIETFMHLYEMDNDILKCNEAQPAVNEQLLNEGFKYIVENLSNCDDGDYV